ncbi:valine--pyruvate transaminase [Cardiobacteriaceae bacterium TAE3-ERU3]|nr:valine--pyruvate transaminase [Cardiobacteriaceae bacterium TAE3-ERU3]
MMQFSSFGEKFTAQSGILRLMADIGEAQASGKTFNMLGVGNPASIAAVNAVFAEVYQQAGEKILDNIASYAPPQGDSELIAALVSFLNRHYGWGISEKNVALTNGSQNAFFYLFNLFGGQFADGTQKKILLPLAPEYIGYCDVHVQGVHFAASQPHISRTTYRGMDGFFKYKVDFDALAQHPDLIAGNIGAICCSRPTNPTGNVLTDEEMARLAAMAREHHVPLIIDHAYGMPFPNIVQTDATMHWDENTILCLSLSKLGMPGLRCGMIVADESVIEAVTALNAIINLAPTRLGAMLATPLLQDDRIKVLSDEVIRPYYAAQTDFVLELLHKAFADLPLMIHQPEGAIFLWLWFPDLPITTSELYARIKAKGTIVIPGEYFFPGIDIADYPHAHECIRISIAQSHEALEAGIADIAAAVRDVYG